MLSADAFARYMLPAVEGFAWGLNQQRYSGAAIFVSPNPSPANARYRLPDYVASYNALAAALARL